jgi:hypothetical protein
MSKKVKLTYANQSGLSGWEVNEWIVFKKSIF